MKTTSYASITGVWNLISISVVNATIIIVMKTTSYASITGVWNLISISVVNVSNGDCCAKSATGNVMRNERDALGVSGKFVRRKMPLRDGTAPAGYNPYDHMPATLHDAAETNNVVKPQSFRTDAE